MLSAIESLRGRGFTKLFNMKCLAHNLHGVANVVRAEYTDVDKVIMGIKTFFRNSPNRRRIFREQAGALGISKLPPFPCFTRWGKWIFTAEYFTESLHLLALANTIIEVKKYEIPNRRIVARAANPNVRDDDIDRFDNLYEMVSLDDNGKGAEIINSAKKIVDEFMCIPKTILKLEKEIINAEDAINLITKIEDEINATRDNFKVKAKLKFVISNNTGFQMIKNYFNNNHQTTIPLTLWSDEELNLLNTVPFSSASIERVFSIYKSMYRENRRSFKFTNFRKFVICKCALNSVSFCTNVQIHF